MGRAHDAGAEVAQALRYAEAVARLHAEERVQRRRAEDALAKLERAFADTLRALEAQRELDRLKDDFVARVSHELRTPLTAILAYVETLLDDATGPLSPLQRTFLGVVDRNGDRLLRVVDDLLLVAHAPDGRMEIRPQEVDLEELVLVAVDGALPVAGQRRIELTLESDAIPTFHGDPVRISQLVRHLLSNALGSTPEDGSVSVRLATMGHNVIVEVSDSGAGIPPDELPHVFERFFRTKAATADEVQGAGIGLTIVRMIVDAHAGTVAVDSEQGLGSTFRVTLPLRRELSPGSASDAVAAQVNGHLCR